MESGDTTTPQHEGHSGTVYRKRLIVTGVVILGLAVIVLWATGLGRQLIQKATYAGRPATFSGRSQDLKQTVIVPTRDSPCPPGKNVIWCSSFQLAWNELRDKVIGAPLQVTGAEEIAARLNAAKQSGSDLEPRSFYATGGWIKDGIIDKIKKDMAAKFPSHVLADFKGYNDGILTYSYLKANVPFKYPFRQMDRGLAFTDSHGVETDVVGFGLWKAFLSQYKNIREQLEILSLKSEDPNNPWEPKEYAIDLWRRSKPYQVVVARVELKDSLAETLTYIQRQTEEFKRRSYYEEARRFQANDVLEVPEMVWRIDHRFTELIDKPLVNVGMPIVEAMQTIQFRLDRSGAAVEGEATIAAKAIPREFVFDRPFLIYMQKRGAAQPFFVMWVDNAELLVRR